MAVFVHAVSVSDWIYLKWLQKDAPKTTIHICRRHLAILIVLSICHSAMPNACSLTSTSPISHCRTHDASILFFCLSPSLLYSIYLPVSCFCSNANARRDCVSTHIQQQNIRSLWHTLKSTKSRMQFIQPLYSNFGRFQCNEFFFCVFGLFIGNYYGMLGLIRMHIQYCHIFLGLFFFPFFIRIIVIFGRELCWMKWIHFRQFRLFRS